MTIVSEMQVAVTQLTDRAVPTVVEIPPPPPVVLAMAGCDGVYLDCSAGGSV
jgi:hypothetical protein